MSKQPVSVLVVIHTPALEVLLIERASHPGFWQSVTGSREDDESLMTTALREVREETGIEADPTMLRCWNLSNHFEIFEEWRHRYAAGVTHNLEQVFSLQVPAKVDVQLAPEEHRAACWLPCAEAAEKVFSWTNRDALLLLALNR